MPIGGEIIACPQGESPTELLSLQKQLGGIMETTQIKLDKNVVDKAVAYARKRGVDLSSLIEDYLKRLVQQSKTEEEPIPDIVLSLLGAGQSVGEEDLNGREAYQKHLEEKYR